MHSKHDLRWPRPWKGTSMSGEFAGPSPEARRQKSGLLRVIGLSFIGGLVVLILLVIGFVAMHKSLTAGATLAKALMDVKALATAVDEYRAHTGAPPATLAELTSPATNARGQTAGPYLASIPRSSPGF